MFQMRAKMISVGLLGAAILFPLNLVKADQLGHASWYSLPANKTANGERMNPNELTAAHRSLPFGTRVLVENLSNGRSVVVRINDRGPFVGGRIIDLSKAAAATIGMLNSGTAKVRVMTPGGNALAALGNATTKAKDGAAKAVMAKADLTPAPKVTTDLARAEKTPHKVTTVAYKPSAKKRLGAKAPSRRQHLAAKSHTQANVRVASVNFKRNRSRYDVAEYSKGIRAAAFQASGLSSRRMIVASNQNPYAILGGTPGFMKSARARRAG
jgi:peptidoglycan lytic transglycosylase